MNGWIEKNIDPPGIHQKNRGSLFSAIGNIFTIVKDDALTAFNAHFPYLADEQKLAEHGRALEVPRFVNDSSEEYRDRVAAASFYHMKTGERGYIKSQLAAHFGDRFITKEEFLQIYLQVLDLTDDEIAWAQNFLDEITDPNISLNFIAGKKLTDKGIIKGHWRININSKLADTVRFGSAAGIRLNLLFRDAIGWPTVRYDGQYAYDGSVYYQQNFGWHDAVRVAAVPQNTDHIYHGDEVAIALKLFFQDNFNRGIRYDGKYAYDGSVEYHSGSLMTDRFSLTKNYTEKLRDTGKLADAVRVTADPRNVDRMYHGDGVLIGLKLLFKDRFSRDIRYDGKYAYDGSVEYHSGSFMADRFSLKKDYAEKLHETGKLSDRVKSGIVLRTADTAGMKSKVSIKVRKSTEYNGEITYDGSHDYGGETVQEVQ